MAYTTETLDNGAVVIYPRAAGQIWQSLMSQFLITGIDPDGRIVAIWENKRIHIVDGDFDTGVWSFVDWKVPFDLARFPQKCPRCGDPAYVGFNSIDCSRSGCR